MRIGPTKRWWIRLSIGVATVVAIALIANGFMSWRTERRLEARLAKIRAAGDPASISDLAPPPIADEENAAAALEQLGPRLDAFSTEYGPFAKTAEGEAYDERVDAGELPTAEQIAAIRAILDRYPDIPVGLMEAAARPQYASKADFSLDHMAFLEDRIQAAQRIRTAARFLEWRFEVLLSEGKNEEAVKEGVALLRLARLYDAEPLLVNFLVGVAVRGLAVNLLYDALSAGPVSPEIHAEVDQELARHDTPQRIVHALTTDRAFSAEVAANAGISAALYPSRPFYVGVVSWPMKRHFIGAMDYLDLQIALVEKAWPMANRRVGRGPAPGRSDLGVMADLLIPGLQASYDAESRIVAVMRALRIYNALTAYRDERGKEASGPADLSLPKEATIDPFSGQPLKLKHTDDGWIVYSVMQNGVDDGGDFKDLKDFGVAPRRLRLTSKPEESADEPKSAAKR